MASFSRCPRLSYILPQPRFFFPDFENFLRKEKMGLLFQNFFSKK